MAILQHVEIASRELDSKLFLGVVAAMRGHDVILGDVGSLMSGVRAGCFDGSVFHTKSLSPGRKKIERHQEILDHGIAVSSIDEEGNLVDYGYEVFGKLRFSNESVSQASAIFCWGKEDYEFLTSKYSSHAGRIHLTGSPRADLWAPEFSKVWVFGSVFPSRPFLLVASNMGVPERPFMETIRFLRSAGYFDRDSDMFKQRFFRSAENLKMVFYFVEAIKHLSSVSDGFDIVLRPHPTDSVEAWKSLLHGVPHVHVVREGSINAWLNGAFALMHNGSTTALEATVSGVPVITFSPFVQEFARQLSNDLGEQVTELVGLERVVTKFFEDLKQEKTHRPSAHEREIVSQKIAIDPNKWAAEKIADVWEQLDLNPLLSRSALRSFKITLWKSRLRAVAGRTFRRLTSKTRAHPKIDLNKFPPIDLELARSKVRTFEKMLHDGGSLNCELLADRVLRISPKARD